MVSTTSPALRAWKLNGGVWLWEKAKRYPTGELATPQARPLGNAGDPTVNTRVFPAPSEIGVPESGGPTDSVPP
jgi:hypothetical protein